MRVLLVLVIVALLASFTLANIHVDVNVHIENNNNNAPHDHTIEKPVENTNNQLLTTPFILPESESAEIDSAVARTSKIGEFWSNIGNSIRDTTATIARWLKKFHKRWSAAELIKRTRILKNNLIRIIKHNSKPNRHSTQALNEYSDMDDEEFARTLTNSIPLDKFISGASVASALSDEETLGTEADFDEAFPPPSPRPVDIDPLTGEGGIKVDEAGFDDADDDDYEPSPPVLGQFDWRRQGKVVPPRAQLKCGGCWAFAASDALSSAAAIKFNRPPVLLSPQYLIDCNTEPDPSFRNHANIGCRGGATQVAFHWLTTNYHILEQNYPYRGNNGNGCNVGPSVQRSYIKTSTETNPLGFVQVRLDLNRMISELRLGPAVVLVEGAAPVFRDYHSGIITQNCVVPGKPSNHAVLLVGYGSENGIDYWVVKNSWSQDWGEAGYVRIRRGQNVCGIEEWFVRPLA